MALSGFSIDGALLVIDAAWGAEPWRLDIVQCPAPTNYMLEIAGFFPIKKKNTTIFLIVSPKGMRGFHKLSPNP